jgi:insulysin
LTAKYLLEDFKYDELAASLQMLDPRRATVAVICRELPKNVDLTFDKKEPIYGTDYCERKFSPEFLKEVSACFLEFRIWLMRR